jgi:hypothetical protein
MIAVTLRASRVHAYDVATVGSPAAPLASVAPSIQ